MCLYREMMADLQTSHNVCMSVYMCVCVSVCMFVITYKLADVVNVKAEPGECSIVFFRQLHHHVQ